VTVSDVLRDELINRGVEPDRIVVYPNCVDDEIFNPGRFDDRTRVSVRERLGIRVESVLLMFLGTFGPWHGAEVLAQAIEELQREDSDWLQRKKVHVAFIGDGQRRSAVEHRLRSARQAKTVSLPGIVPQHEAAEYLSAADILISPHVPNEDGTRFFGSPTKLFEYMAMEKAIIASDLEQIGDVLRNSLQASNLPSGTPLGAEADVSILCTPGSVAELKAAIRFAVENKEWRDLLAKNARREVFSRYTWRQHVGAILQQMQRLNLSLDFAVE
jgi:glycosyltransferase involved in cell wall biosynthesis